MIREDILKGVVLGSLKIGISDYEEVKKTCIVVLDGYIDTYNAVTFKEKLSALIEGGYLNFIVDCEKLKYISSSGVGSLIAILKDLRSVNGSLVLFRIQPEVYQVIQILGFAKIIRKFDSFSEINEFYNGKNTDVLHFKSEPAKFTFPAIAVCPACSKKMKISHEGRFRCIDCKSIFSVSNDGKIILQESSLFAAG